MLTMDPRTTPRYADHPLRDLAKKIRALVSNHTAASQAQDIVEHACRVLELTAFYNETLHKDTYGHGKTF